MTQNINVNTFLTLLRAGLWGKANDNVNDNFVDGLAVNWADVIQLAEAQSVLGLVAAGMEKLPTDMVPLTEKLILLGKCQLIEQQNVAMNHFVARLVAQMREASIGVVLVKGQGVAQCYERPLWRSSGDVDFLLCEENYEKAKAVLNPFASLVDKESVYNKHLGLTIGGYSVELHGNLRCGLSKRMDGVIDEVQQEVFNQGKKRVWTHGTEPINLPATNEDIVFIFTHFLKHFYKGGLGLRQICDWCRLLWTYKDTLNYGLLESRIRKMGLMSEWKAFATFAVEYLGMPVVAMPLYSSKKRWKRKAERICSFVMEVGNMGHNRDMSYYNAKPYLIKKSISVRYRWVDLLRHMAIFPLDSIRFFPMIMINGLRSAARGE